ncbi:MAG: YfhO family protein [Lachnospiraceae bacterium]|nr:YfhO family protein [Lachnospiraceae bacterium]
MKKFGRKGWIYLAAFCLPFLMVQAFFALCGIYPYGPSSILTGDMNIEFVNFYAYFVNIFHTKNDFSYMLAKTLGGDYPGLAAFQLHDPLLLILLFFPGEKIAAGIELVFALQVSIAGLCMSILLNNRYRPSVMSLLFSTAYSFCGFFFGYLVLTIYFGSIAILPLVIYFFLEYLDDRKFFVPYVLTTAFSIYVNYHMGFMLVIFLTLLYLTRLIQDGGYFKRLGGFVYSGITILLIDGFFLLRTGLSLLGEKTTEGADYGFYKNFGMSQLFAQLFSGSSRNAYMPLIYSSVAAAFFFILYFLSKQISLRQKLADGVLLAMILLSMQINAIDAVWHGFNNPEGFYWRYAYLASFLIIVMGYQGFIDLAYGEGGRAFRLICVATAGAAVFLYMFWLVRQGNPYLDAERQKVNIVLVAVAAAGALLVCIGGKIRAAGLLLIFALSLPDMLYDAKVIYMKLNADDGELPAMADFEEDYRQIHEAVSFVKSRDGGFYRLEKDFDRGINDPAMFDYIGISHDSSCEKDEILDWLKNFGFCKTVYYTFYNGGSTSFADAFFGVRYLLSKHSFTHKPYESLGEAGGCTVFEDGFALPMAFAAPGELSGLELGSGNTFEKQNRIASSWPGAPEIYHKAEAAKEITGAVEEEEGHYVRTEEEGYITYRIRITESMPLYFYFDAPERQSGEVLVNGESLGWYFTENHWNVLCAGTFDPGETVEIRMQILKEELRVAEECFYYEDKEALGEWASIASGMNEALGEVEEISSSHLKFTADIPEGEMAVLSIPYDKAWKITCGGKGIKAEPALGMLLGMRLPEGEHEIEMKYIPRGTLPGALLSLFGLGMFFAVQWPEQKKKGRGRKTG